MTPTEMEENEPTDEQARVSTILQRLEGPPRRSLRASELTATQHAMPKTYVSHAILHENPSHERHLSLHMSKLARRQHQFATNHDILRKAFIDQQQRKHRTWKQQDENKAAAMNFPNIKSRPSQCEVLYKSPSYFMKTEEDTGEQRIMPYMSVQRERTQFLLHDGKTFMTRLPTVVVTDPHKMERYDTYCGKEMLDPGCPAKDLRFQQLTTSLSAPSELRHTHLVSQQHDQQKSRVVFPALTRSDTFAESRYHRDNARLDLHKSKTDVESDVRSMGVDELRHKYGKLNHEYRSPTHQRNFAVKSATKTPIQQNE